MPKRLHYLGPDDLFRVPDDKGGYTEFAQGGEAQGVTNAQAEELLTYPGHRFVEEGGEEPAPANLGAGEATTGASGGIAVVNTREAPKKGEK